MWPVHGDPTAPALASEPPAKTAAARSVTAADARAALRSETEPRSLTERSATELAGMIRRREVTSRQVLEAHIDRLALTEPRVHGIVGYRYRDAREAADAADARIAAAAPEEELPPLLGVPCTIKESIGVKDMPNTAGFKPVAERKATAHAPAVRRLMEAGAIPIGVTNTSELCLWIEATNRVYGDTANPYDVTRTVGGSSGGEGAVIGSGGVPFGLGSDLAGSIRVPAFCCGVFGHKPSVGVVPTTGHFPMGAGPSRRMMVIGPLARRAEDLMPLMRILNYDDPEDPYDREIPLGDPTAVKMAGLRVVVPDGFGATSFINKEMIQARERVISHLSSQGADIVRVSARGLIKTQIVFVEALRGALDEEFNSSVGWEMERVRDMYRGLRATEGEHTAAFVNLMSLAQLVGRLRPAGAAHKLEAYASKLAAQFSEQIGDGVMLLPPMPRAAPPHGWTTLRPWAMQTMVPANLFGFPSTQIPLGFGQEGLPLGVQVMAPMDQDHRSIAVALELERAFGGWVAPEHAPAAPAPAVRRATAVRRAAVRGGLAAWERRPVPTTVRSAGGSDSRSLPTRAWAAVRGRSSASR